MRTGKFSDVAKLGAALGEHSAVNFQDRHLPVGKACIATKSQTRAPAAGDGGVKRCQEVFVIFVPLRPAFWFSMPDPTIAKRSQFAPPIRISSFKLVKTSGL